MADADGSRDAFTAAYLARAVRGRHGGSTPAWLPVDVVEQALADGCALAARVLTRHGSRPF
jgi:sugar/nucleoside kinase (ribokinase family)